MKMAFVLSMLFFTKTYASQVSEVCILNATSRGTDALVEIICDSRVLKSDPVPGEYANFRTHKAKAIKWLLSQGYEMKSEEVFVK